MFKIIGTLFYASFVTLVIGIAGLLIATMLPIPGNIEVKIVKSGSMEPAIPTGSVVVVKPAAEYRFNDVITFGEDTKTEIPTTHRIIGIANTQDSPVYTTKGDANEEQDPNPVERREVIGKVIVHVPYAGFVLDFARQPMGFALLIGVPAALVILEELLTIFKELGRWRRRRKDDEDHRGGPRNVELMLSGDRIVATKRRPMDEIFIPMALDLKKRLRAHAPDAYGASMALVVGLVVMSSLFMGANGSTLAYFQDIERSVGNIFQAASCDAFRDGSCDVATTTAEVPLQTFSLLAEPEGEVAGAATTTGDETGTTTEKKAPESGGSPPDSGATSPASTTPDEPAEPADTPADEPEEPESGSPEGGSGQTAPIDPTLGSGPEGPEPGQTPSNDPVAGSEPPGPDPASETPEPPPADLPAQAGDPPPPPDPVAPTAD